MLHANDRSPTRCSAGSPKRGRCSDFQSLTARSAQTPLRHPPPDRHQHRGVLCGPHAGNVRQMWCWLVLVVAPAPLFARGSTDRAVCNELRCVSARDDYDCSDGPAVTTFHDHEFARSPAPSASILRPRRSLVEARACMVRKNADFSYALPERRVTIRNPCVRNGPGGIWRTRHDSNV